MRVQGKDYTKKDEDVLVIKLPDAAGPTGWERFKRWLGVSDDGFELSILPPTKRLYDSLAELAAGMSGVADGELEAEKFDLDGALSTVASIMSRNVEGREVTPAMLDDMGFDLEDVGEFIGSYVFFIQELVEAKN